MSVPLILPLAALAEALESAALEVLDTMFFTAAEPGSAPGFAGDMLRARVRFGGGLRGSLVFSVEPGAATALAGAFLGAQAEEVSDAQVLEVLAEAANMICGAVLSRVEHYGNLALEPPVILPPAEEIQTPDPLTEWLAMPEGAAGVALRIEP